MHIVRSLHQRLQGYFDCYVESDLEFEMRHIARPERSVLGDDTTEMALKYLALVLLTAIDQRAEKLIIARWASRLLGGKECLLATPRNSIVDRAITIVKEITGADSDTPLRELALGLGNDRLTLDVEHRIVANEEEVLFGLGSLRN